MQKLHAKLTLGLFSPYFRDLFTPFCLFLLLETVVSFSMARGDKLHYTLIVVRACFSGINFDLFRFIRRFYKVVTVNILIF